nr:relaxase/mobilization nuclease domain-containing protein [Aggregatibacter actinomycetemcomitans]
MFVLAYHGDTDNPHCHVILKIADNNGNRVNINLHDLQEIRTHFARYLNSLSVEAKATPFKNQLINYLAELLKLSILVKIFISISLKIK